MSYNSSCQYCERRFNKSYNLMIHERSHLVPLDYERNYYDLNHFKYQQHKMSKSSRNSGYSGSGNNLSYLFVCDICGDAFKRHDGLKYHRASQHSPSTLSSSGSNSSGSSD